MDKRCKDLVEAVDPIKDGARIMIGGFGSSGIPFGLIDALLGNGARGPTKSNWRSFRKVRLQSVSAQRGRALAVF